MDITPIFYPIDHHYGPNPATNTSPPNPVNRQMDVLPCPRHGPLFDRERELSKNQTEYLYCPLARK
jgi:hypothetical protein